MTTHIFLALLLVVSVLTGLFTEAFKKFLSERGKTYYSNALAGYCAIGISIFVGVGYIVLAGEINIKMFVYLIALMLLSWLSAMVGYDKVVQAITQFDTTDKADKRKDD